jgi:hypothetical protein
MAVNWTSFQQNITNFIDGKFARNEKDLADAITNGYDSSIKFGAKDSLVGNTILTTNATEMKRILANGFRMAKLDFTGKHTKTILRSAFASAVISYWTGATLSTAIPNPGAVRTISNYITFPGVPPAIIIENSNNSREFASKLSTLFRVHLLTLQGLTTGVTANAVVVPTPFVGII